MSGPVTILAGGKWQRAVALKILQSCRIVVLARPMKIWFGKTRICGILYQLSWGDACKEDLVESVPPLTLGQRGV